MKCPYCPLEMTPSDARQINFYWGMHHRNNILLIHQAVCLRDIWMFHGDICWGVGGLGFWHTIVSDLWSAWSVTICTSRPNLKTGPRLKLFQRQTRSQGLFLKNEIWRIRNIPEGELVRARMYHEWTKLKLIYKYINNFVLSVLRRFSFF